MDFESITGQGIQARVDDRFIVIGNATLLQDLDIEIGTASAKAEHHRGAGATVVWVAIDGQLAGLLSVADPIKDSTAGALQALQQSGLKIVMATGDNKTTAAAIGERLGIDEIHAELSRIEFYLLF